MSGWLTGGYLVGGKRLLWSGLTVLSVMLSARASLPVWPPLALFICFRLWTPAPENTICRKKMIGWKNRPFFITENFPGILNKLCMEPIHRSHDFLRLTLAVVWSTSGRCYFLQQCRCLLVSVLCVLVGSCVKS